MRIVSAMTRFGVLILVSLVVLLPLSAVQSQSLAGTWKVSWTDAQPAGDPSALHPADERPGPAGAARP
jgi:hypothetical protein